MTNNNAMPSQLNGPMADIWNELYQMNPTDPKAVRKVTDPAKMPLIDSLVCVGGCMVEKAEDGTAEVTLQFELEVSETEMIDQVGPAVAQKHKFA